LSTTMRISSIFSSIINSFLAFTLMTMAMTGFGLGGELTAWWGSEQHEQRWWQWVGSEYQDVMVGIGKGIIDKIDQLTHPPKRLWVVFRIFFFLSLEYTMTLIYRGDSSKTLTADVLQYHCYSTCLGPQGPN
jgi:hypothetical protein